MDSVDIEVLRSAEAWRKAGHRVTFGTIVRTWGSAPRPGGRPGGDPRRRPGRGLGLRRLRRGRPDRQGARGQRGEGQAAADHLRRHQRGGDALGAALRRHARAGDGAGDREKRVRRAARDHLQAATRAPPPGDGQRPRDDAAGQRRGRAGIRRQGAHHGARPALAPDPDRRRAADALPRRDGAHARLPGAGDRSARGVRRRLGPDRACRSIAACRTTCSRRRTWTATARWWR